MNYTDKFCQLPCVKIFNLESTGELNNENIPLAGSVIIDSVCFINPFDISAYEPDSSIELDGDETAVVCTRVELRGGASYIISLTIEEFETVINSHQSQLNQVR